MAYTFKSHSADILALAASNDQSAVFATGVDPIIRRFDLCVTENSCKWCFLFEFNYQFNLSHIITYMALVWLRMLLD